LKDAREIDTVPGDMSAIICSDNLTLSCAVLDNAIELDSIRLKEKTFELYQNLFEYISSSPHQNVIRMWNHIPSICTSLENGKQRYCAFNEGRFDAMSSIYGMDDILSKKIPAASAVGFSGKN